MANSGQQAEALMKGLGVDAGKIMADGRIIANNMGIAISRRSRAGPLSVIWPTSLLDMILKAQEGVRKLMERRAKLTGLDAPEKVQEVGPVSDAEASLLAKWNKMAERMRAAEIAAPMKDVTPLIEHEPSADAKTETDMIRFADAGETVTNRDDVTKRTASRNGSDPVTKPSPVTKPYAKGGRPKIGANPLTPAERQRAARERRKAAAKED
jgi:hypothetical protein